MMNLFKNVNTVIEDVQEFSSKIGDDDYTSGFKLGDILGIYIYGALPKLSTVNPKDFTIGLFTGMRATDKVTEGYACVSDISAFIPEV